MRRIDLHCYPGTKTWIASQGPYIEALGAYWGKEWAAKSEEQVVADVTAAGVQAVLVAFDIESLTGAPGCPAGWGHGSSTPGRSRSTTWPPASRR